MDILNFPAIPGDHWRRALKASAARRVLLFGCLFTQVAGLSGPGGCHGSKAADGQMVGRSGMKAGDQVRCLASGTTEAQAGE